MKTESNVFSIHVTTSSTAVKQILHSTPTRTIETNHTGDQIMQTTPSRPKVPTTTVETNHTGDQIMHTTPSSQQATNDTLALNGVTRQEVVTTPFEKTTWQVKHGSIGDVIQNYETTNPSFHSSLHRTVS